MTPEQQAMQEMTLSDLIRTCKLGAVNNPYQGKDKKVLFVCTLGILRSATAARIYAKRYNTRAVGTAPDALIPLTYMLVQWASEIVFVNPANYLSAKYKIPELEHMPNVKVLDIPDTLQHMHPELIKEFEQQYEPI